MQRVVIRLTPVDTCGRSFPRSIRVCKNVKTQENRATPPEFAPGRPEHYHLYVLPEQARLSSGMATLF